MCNRRKTLSSTINPERYAAQVVVTCAAAVVVAARRKPMERNEVRKRLDAALGKLVREDGYLLANNLGERCIAARLAMYLQHEFPDHNVDAEYNRDADT